MKPNIYLVSNSPGEVSTFVRPVHDLIRRRFPDWDITVCLVPCPYATGAEATVIRSWSEAATVWSPLETTLNWLRASGRQRPGAVVFLGGDPWHALLLKSRFRLPALAYFALPSGWEKTRIAGGFERIARGYRSPTDDPSGVGDLRVDAVQDALPVITEPRPLTLALFPGSRWIHLKASLGPFLEVVDRVADEELRVVLAASPYITPSRLDNAARKPWTLGLAYSTAQLQDDTLLTAAGNRIEVVWGDPYRVMAECDLALSLPGTNTAELAIAGKPTVVPLSEKAPVGGAGILGLIDRLPGLKGLKQRLKLKKFHRHRFLALPNQIAEREVIPEFFVDDDLSNLYTLIRRLLNDRAERERIGREAREVMGDGGAAQRLVDQLESLV